MEPCDEQSRINVQLLSDPHSGDQPVVAGPLRVASRRVQDPLAWPHIAQWPHTKATQTAETPAPACPRPRCIQLAHKHHRPKPHPLTPSRPPAGQLLPVLHHFLSATAPNLLGCRCRATEAAGLLFEGLGGSCAQLRALAPALMEMGLKVRIWKGCV